MVADIQSAVLNIAHLYFLLFISSCVAPMTASVRSHSLLNVPSHVYHTHIVDGARRTENSRPYCLATATQEPAVGCMVSKTNTL
jgi:hypothetical protein